MFRLTIRDALWLMVVVVMGVGWAYTGLGYWMSSAMCKDELKAVNEETARLRTRITDLEGQK